MYKYEADFLSSVINAMSDLVRVINKNGEAKDIHEQDEKYLKKAYSVGKWVADYYNWEQIACTNENGELKTIEEIHNMIYSSLNKLAEREKE